MPARPAPAVLEATIASSLTRLEALRRELGRARLRALAEAGPPPRRFGRSLAGPGISLIAELKRRSPSGGELRPELDPAAVAADLAGAGAVALSVLTEPESFGGSLADLRSARGAVAVPVLRKDFLLGPEQVLEARAAGADAVLLIVRVLTRSELEGCLEACVEVGIDALVEVHDEPDLEAAVAAGARLIGINNRDLDRLTVDLETTPRLARLAPAGTVLVAESGVRTPGDLARIASSGVVAALVGEALMRAPDPGWMLGQLVAALPPAGPS